MTDREIRMWGELNAASMTKREYFISVAISGILSSGNWVSPQRVNSMAIQIADDLVLKMQERYTNAEASE